MTRDDALRRLMALDAHGRADSPEGRTARRVAARLRRRYRITRAQVARHAQECAEDARRIVDLDGWGEPWLVVLVRMVANVAGLVARADVHHGALRVRLQGAGAGRTARHLGWLRAVVEARADHLGEARIRALSLSSFLLPVPGAVFVSGADFTRPTLARFGRAAPDLYRLMLARALLEIAPPPSPPAPTDATPEATSPAPANAAGDAGGPRAADEEADAAPVPPELDALGDAVVALLLGLEEVASYRPGWAKPATSRALVPVFA